MAADSSAHGYPFSRVRPLIGRGLPQRSALAPETTDIRAISYSGQPTPLGPIVKGAGVSGIERRFCFESEEILDWDNAIIAIGSIKGTGSGSGAETEVPIAFVSRFRDGLVVRVEEYLDRD